jgi:DNA-3-methyladenine glycosylase
MTAGPAPRRYDAAAAKRLPRAFYDRDTEAVARDLLGKWLVRATDGTPRIGRIVEVEAYLGPEDRASHSSKGLTPRTRVMFGPPGYAYVYLVYGLHYCMNVVTGPVGRGSAVLLRALEPLLNVDGSPRGPGRLCRAMGIDLGCNAFDLTRDEFHIAGPPEDEDVPIVKRPRVGVAYAGAWARRLLRFYIRGNPYVSKL